MSHMCVYDFHKRLRFHQIPYKDTENLKNCDDFIQATGLSQIPTKWAFSVLKQFRGNKAFMQ